MTKLTLVSAAADSPGAAGSSKKTIASKAPKKTEQNKRFYGEWEQPFQLQLEGNLLAAVPQWIARIHADFATFGGLPVIDGESLWFNAWSIANLLEWTDTAAFGELEPLRLRRLAVEAMELKSSRMRSPERKMELIRKIDDLARTQVGLYSRKRYAFARGGTCAYKLNPRSR